MTTAKELSDQITKAMEGTYKGKWTLDTFTEANGNENGYIMCDGTIIAEIAGALKYCGNRENGEYIIATQPKNMRVILSALALLPGKPVAWRYAVDDTSWDVTTDRVKAEHLSKMVQVQPLYISPTPHPSVDRDGLLEEMRRVIEPFARGSIDISATAVIVGYPETRAALDAARSFLSKLEAYSNAKD
jgi:hypothetical protein